MSNPKKEERAKKKCIRVMEASTREREREIERGKEQNNVIS
jgi:hypothetical protein